MKTIQVMDENRHAVVYRLIVADNEHKMLRDSGAIYEEEELAGDDGEIPVFNHIGVNLAHLVDLLAGFQPERFDHKVSIYLADETRVKLIWFLGEMFPGLTYDSFIKRAIRASAKGAVKAVFEKELKAIDVNRERANCTCRDGGSGLQYTFECPRHGAWLKRYNIAAKNADALGRVLK